jgi:hypothetical protein
LKASERLLTLVGVGDSVDDALAVVDGIIEGSFVDIEIDGVADGVERCSSVAVAATLLVDDGWTVGAAVGVAVGLGIGIGVSVEKAITASQAGSRVV